MRDKRLPSTDPDCTFSVGGIWLADAGNDTVTIAVIRAARKPNWPWRIHPGKPPITPTPKKPCAFPQQGAGSGGVPGNCRSTG